MRYTIWTFLILLILLQFLSCNTPTQSNIVCAKYRTGKFYYRFIVDDSSFTYHINRTDSIQQEINEETHDTTTLHIRWLNDCTYELRFIKSTEVLPDSVFRIRKSIVMKTSIESDDEGYYISKTKADLYDVTREDTIWLDRQIKPIRVH